MKNYLLEGPFWDGYRSVARWLILPLLVFVVWCLCGCGVTRSAITTTAPDGVQSTCSALTLTLGKDVSGAKMDCAAGSGWSVDNSDPNAEMMRTLSGMLPVILRAVATPVAP